ncbi:MAG: hypothetical protein ACI9CE_003934, partial [Flavobacterium sp.]
KPFSSQRLSRNLSIRSISDTEYSTFEKYQHTLIF